MKLLSTLLGLIGAASVPFVVKAGKDRPNYGYAPASPRELAAWNAAADKRNRLKRAKR